MQVMGVSSLAELGEIGNVTAIVEAVGKVAGIANAGWDAHHRGLIKNGANLLHPSQALIAHSFSTRLAAATEKAALAGPEALAAPVPAVPFKERLAMAGYAAIHPSARPSQEMVEVVVAAVKSTKRTCPYLDSQLHPWRDNAWSKEKKGKEAVVAAAPDLAGAAGGMASLSADMIARAALMESAEALSEREMAGTWLASLSRIAHSLAIAGCLGDGGLAVAAGVPVGGVHPACAASPPLCNHV